MKKKTKSLIISLIVGGMLGFMSFLHVATIYYVQDNRERVFEVGEGLVNVLSIMMR